MQLCTSGDMQAINILFCKRTGFISVSQAEPFMIKSKCEADVWRI